MFPMKYRAVVEARFVSRPNRFVAVVDLDGREIVERPHGFWYCGMEDFFCTIMGKFITMRGMK